MPTYSKVIPFPIRVAPRAGFDAGIYPRFAKAFGDRSNVPEAVIGLAKRHLALINPLKLD